MRFVKCYCAMRFAQCFQRLSLERTRGMGHDVVPLCGYLSSEVISAPSQRSVDAAMGEIDGLLAAGRRR